MDILLPCGSSRYKAIVVTMSFQPNLSVKRGCAIARSRLLFVLDVFLLHQLKEIQWPSRHG